MLDNVLCQRVSIFFHENACLHGVQVLKYLLFSMYKQWES